jgi:hypothetical protein
MHKVGFSVVISQILDEISNATTDANKLLIIENAREQLQGGMGSLNDIWICKDNGHLTDDEESDNQKLEEFRVRLQDLMPQNIKQNIKGSDSLK